MPGVVLSQSLGEIARQVRAERAKQKQQPVKVYTNDNISQLTGTRSTIFSSAGQNATSPEQPAVSGSSSGLQSATLKSSAFTTSATEKKQAAKSEAQQAHSASNPNPAEQLQSQIKVARATLAHTIEEQRLAEDELSLLQMQQARELNPSRSRALSSQVEAKETEAAAKRAEAEKARQSLDLLEQEYKKVSSAESREKQ